MLEDHIKSAHPRLVKRVEPKNFTSDSGRHVDCCIRDEPHTYYPPVVQVVPVAPEKPRSKKPHGKEAAYSPRQAHEEHKPQTQGKRVGRCSNGKKVMVSSRSSVPASQRYNFYRQYGFAGQGAKTSNGWHMK
ncbi:hypothetical protein BDL97_07G018200 [Sphagnum fallax]|nr:hypothetical protein BDL97_07G018200 [Sphagnum fallax]